MLTHLQIKDLAIVSALSIDFTDGMSALTGETGAGKSILIDALGLALGDPTANEMIRCGRERAEVTAIFDTQTIPEAENWLQEHELNEDGECILRRVLVRDGRSRAFINGRPASIQLLQKLGQMLVDIHGQHAHQSLLRSRNQRRLLDAHGKHLPLANEVAQLFRSYQSLSNRLQDLKAAASDRISRIELLQHQAHELSELNLTPQELKQLDREHHRLSNLGQLQEGCAWILHEIYESDHSVQQQLHGAVAKLEQLQILDPRLEEQHDYIEGALIQIQEGASSLRDYVQSLEIDPTTLQQIESRLSEIHDMARKYRVRADELPDRLQSINSELEGLEQADTHLDALEQETEQLRQRFFEKAEALSGQRRKSAEKLGKTITGAMQKLGMQGGRFTAALTPLTPQEAGPNGLEQVEFLVSANPGQPEQPLTRVASGGELSRISLAIQVATIECGSVPCLIFDEVDVGIGGRIAEIVGQLLRQLGRSRQILCVTHLPQVAAQAHNHFLFSKSLENSQTKGAAAPLDREARIDEIARMLGGIDITSQTLAHAKEMLDKAAI